MTAREILEKNAPINSLDYGEGTNRFNWISNSMEEYKNQETLKLKEVNRELIRVVEFFQKKFDLKELQQVDKLSIETLINKAKILSL